MRSDRRPLVYTVVIGALVLLAVIVLWASRKPGPGSAQVTGVITLNGKPLEGLEVTFMPDPTKGGSGPGASGYTDAQGRFRIGSAGSLPGGASPGFHRVVISDPVASAPPGADPVAARVADPGAEDLPPPKGAPPKLPGAGIKSRPPRIPRQYGDVSGTPLVDIELKSGAQQLDFELGPNKK